MPPAPMIPHPQQLATGVFPIFPPINQDLSMFASLQAGADGSEDNPGYTGLQQPTASYLGLPYDAVHEGMFVISLVACFAVNGLVPGSFGIITWP